MLICDTVGIGYINSGMIENFIAGGTEFMSDVPIRHSRKMRSIMLQSTKAKTAGQKFALFSKVGLLARPVTFLCSVF